MLVSIILLASLAVILINQISGAKPNPRPTDTTGTPSVTTQGSQTAAPTASPATSAPIRDLSIQTAAPLREPGAAQPEMMRWPASSSVETVRTVDLAAYLGKSRSDKPLEGITVVLDPGHGGIDSGCGWPVGVRDQDIMEKDVVLSVAQSASQALRTLGANVILLREDDTFLSIFERPALVGSMLLEDFTRHTQSSELGIGPLARLTPLLDSIVSANDDLFGGVMGGSGTREDLKQIMDIERQYPDWLLISIHCNAAADYPNVHGLQVYYTSSAVILHDERIECQSLPSSDWEPSYQYYDDGGRMRLASLLYDSIVSEVPALGQGTSAPLVDQDFAVLREQNLVSAMLELGFLTNESDRSVLESASSLERLGDAVADAVYSYYCMR